MTYRFFAFFVLAGGLLCAEEGKWTPQQVLELGPAWLKRQGLELPASRLWDPRRGTGLLAGAASLGNCSAGFVSPTGLMLTNHHCLFSIVQEHSRPDRDLITNGFLARTPEEELRGGNTRVTVPRKFTDVTKEIAAAAPAGAGDLARSNAIEAKEKALVAECEQSPGARCRVAVFDGGVQYVLVESLELSDVRLVYAPPRAVGDFGGEIDNFRWPRHAGDFAVARVYQNGKPYRPEFYFPISKAGVKAGDFVMVLGYPGKTMRALTATEMANQREYYFGLREGLYGEWIRALEDVSAKDRDAAITVAATLKSLNNSHTNAQGQLAGLARGRTLDKQKALDDAVIAWAVGKPTYAKAVEAKKEIDRLAVERRRTATRDFLLQAIQSGPLALKQAVMLVRLAAERPKPDAERDPDFMEREWPRLRTGTERDQKSYYRAADEAMLARWVERALRLGAEERLSAVDQAFGGGDIAAKIGSLYKGSQVADLPSRLRMFEESTEQLRGRRDPLLDFAFALQPELAASQAGTKAHDSAVARLRPEWRRAVIAHAGKPVAPDANARNISVDVRFLLWLLRDVEKADGLLQELGVK